MPTSGVRPRAAAGGVQAGRSERASPADSQPPEAEAEAQLSEQFVRRAPPWLVSLVVHIVLLIVAALITMPPVLRETLELNLITERLGEQLELDLLDTGQLELPEVPVLSVAPLPTDDPLAAPPELRLSTTPNVPMPELAVPTIGLSLAGRTQGMREALLQAYGGTAETESAVALGLAWLRRNQQRDGSWSLQGPYQGHAVWENKSSATAMALLAFQGAGHTHQSGEHQEVVARGWRWMLRLQTSEGSFFQENRAPNNHRIYTHAQAAIALCELYGMTQDSQLREPAQKSIDYLVEIQAREGGWRYSPGHDSDVSVTGWVVMALQSALMADLHVPSSTLYRVSEFLDSCTRDGSRYSYTSREVSRPSLAMTAEALLCRQYLGWSRTDERLLEGVRGLLQNPIDYGREDVYYWYYATQTLHHMGSPHWDEWNAVMRVEVPRQQVKTGPERGSWDPENDAWGRSAGRLYSTCLSIYLLEVYYRHLPIYRELRPPGLR